ncbi:hypothetical protein Igag_1020 [Ignisphaera aggregans DSM 17230]|uniref:Uncharacterized protein n=1 Tax=Ignisphaera aggregans (strain DSM 17230 / JCM 13409 / AQ1.S1) TaxID=583356 RepID=E0SNN8_IGNAA|nr:hypothetical protein Igag_1020 [Ignisphaera aggregans DSM 17230]
MTSGLSDEAYLGFLTSIIVNSPRIDRVSEKLLSEDIDISSAIALGLVPPIYSRFSQIRRLDDLEETLYDFYVKLKNSLHIYSRSKYAGYIDVFYEIYDIEKALSIASLRSRSSLHITPISTLLIVSEIGIGISREYSKCAEAPSIECFYRIYISRIDDALKKIFIRSTNEDYLKCRVALYTFALIRYLSHRLNCMFLKLCRDIEVLKLFKDFDGPERSIAISKSIAIVNRIVSEIESKASKDPSTYFIYESLYLPIQIKDVLMPMNTVPTFLTYLLIYKFYEYKVIRFLAMKGLRWGAR